jgi:hypothetical protein
MKRTISVLLFAMICNSLPAPGFRGFVIPATESINIFTAFVKAVTWVESRDDKYTYNARENAVGAFQITPIRVKDYNRRTRSHYKLEDFYDYELSRKMFLYYARGKNLETAARRWNGSGPKTIQYWNKVQARLKQLTQNKQIINKNYIAMSEKTLHRAVCDFIRLQYPNVHFNSDLSGATKLTIGQAVAIKALRSAKGFPDLQIYKARKYHGFFLELKTEGTKLFKRDGKTPATEHIAEQMQRHKQLREEGYYAEFGIGFEDCIKQINNYLRG